MLVDRTLYHSFELSKITGTVSDISSVSYKESMAQELASHLAHKIKLKSKSTRPVKHTKHSNEKVQQTHT